MSHFQTFQGVARVYRGQRSLGCVGYALRGGQGMATVIRLDPMPDATLGDVFHLTLEDGRILECQVISEHHTFCAVLDGPRAEPAAGADAQGASLANWLQASGLRPRTSHTCKRVLASSPGPEARSLRA